MFIIRDHYNDTMGKLVLSSDSIKKIKDKKKLKIKEKRTSLMLSDQTVVVITL